MIESPFVPPSITIASPVIRAKIFAKRAVVEGPAKIGGVRHFDVDSFGAFSFCRGGWFGAVKSIGRFCSLAPDVTIGPDEHKTSMLSTSTFLNSHSWDCEELEQFRARNKDILTSTLDAIRAPTSRNRMQVVIGNDVWIGQGAIIRKGVTIGDGAVIGANSVISRDVAPYEIVMGVPAQSLRYRFDMKTVERLTEAKWWEFSLESLDGVPWHDPDAASIQLLQRRQQNDFAPAVYPRITYPADTDG